MLSSLQHFFYAGRLDPVLFVVWVVVVVLAAVRTVVVLRRPGPRRRTFFLLLLAPAVCALSLTMLAFTIGHGHPLGQYNATGGVRWFSIWVGAWPLLLLGCLGGCVATFIAFVVEAARDARHPERSAEVAPLAGPFAANVLSLVCVFQNFPSV